MLTASLGLSSSAAVRIVPNPQYYEDVKHSLKLAPGASVVIRIARGEKIRLAAEFLRNHC